jgi:DNA-binding PadR family transcriptional regulator
MPTRRRSAVKNAILGFLIDQPMHGYELKRKLSPALPRERQMNDGVLYPLLRRMEAEGLVRKRVERSESGRDRNVFSVTASGRREFERWLRSSDDEADEATYDFLVGHPFLTKCLFFARLGSDEVKEKLRDQLDDSTRKLETFQSIREGMVARQVDPYRIAVLDLGIAQQKERVRWLKRMVGSTSAAGRRAA